MHWPVEDAPNNGLQRTPKELGQAAAGAAEWDAVGCQQASYFASSLPPHPPLPLKPTVETVEKVQKRAEKSSNKVQGSVYGS